MHLALNGQRLSALLLALATKLDPILNIIHARQFVSNENVGDQGVSARGQILVGHDCDLLRNLLEVQLFLQFLGSE